MITSEIIEHSTTKHNGCQNLVQKGSSHLSYYRRISFGIWPISEIIPKTLHSHHIASTEPVYISGFRSRKKSLYIRIFHLMPIALFNSSHCYLNLCSFDWWNSKKMDNNSQLMQFRALG